MTGLKERGLQARRKRVSRGCVRLLSEYPRVSPADTWALPETGILGPRVFAPYLLFEVEGGTGIMAIQSKWRKLTLLLHFDKP